MRIAAHRFRGDDGGEACNAPILLSALAMTLIVGVRYLVTSGLFAAWTARRFPGRLAGQGAQVRREIGWSLASAAIYGVPAGVVAWGWQERGWTRVYTDVGDYPLWWLPVSVLVYLAAARHLVLLDPSLDAPAALVPRSPMPSTMPAARRPPGRR